MPSKELVLLTGEVDCGKTSWCLSFSEANPGCDGVLLRKVYQGGRRVGYDAFRIATREMTPFSRLNEAGPPDWRPVETVGPFSVSEAGKRAANRWLLEALASPARTLIADEIGPLELAGGGLAEAVGRLLRAETPSSLILVVRRSCLQQMVRQFGLSEYRLVEL